MIEIKRAVLQIQIKLLVVDQLFFLIWGGIGGQVSFFKKNILLLLYYSCPNFSPFALLDPAHPLLPQSIPTLLSVSMGHSYSFLGQSLLLLFTLIPFVLPLWSLSICSLFPCLWVYFARQFILCIRFLLQVRSYGIFLSPTSLFHLA